MQLWAPDLGHWRSHNAHNLSVSWMSPRPACRMLVQLLSQHRLGSHEADGVIPRLPSPVDT